MSLRCGDLPFSLQTSDGAQVAYDLRGSGSSVILIHGFTLDHNVWAAQIDGLAECFRVVALDLRGHGCSSVHPADFRIERVLSDVMELAAHTGSRPAAVCGHSLGTTVAVEWALSDPEAVSALVLISPYVSGVAQPATSVWSTQRETFGGIARREGIPEARKRWLQSALFETVRNRADLRLILERMIARFSGTPWLADPEDASGGPGLIDRISALKCPVLLVCGQQDDILYRSAATAVQTSLSRAELVVVPGAGHLCNLERPDLLNPTLLRFLCGTQGAE